MNRPNGIRQKKGGDEFVLGWFFRPPYLGRGLSDIILRNWSVVAFGTLIGLVAGVTIVYLSRVTNLTSLPLAWAIILYLNGAASHRQMEKELPGEEWKGILQYLFCLTGLGAGLAGLILYLMAP